MPTNNRLAELRLQLKNELERSILVDPEDRDFWLAQLPQLPATTIQNLLDSLTPANTTVDSYVDAALAQDQNQEHLITLKAKFARIKKEALTIEEKSRSKSESSETEELLKQLDDTD
ncbi:hypothetical protein IT411_04160 [Candidatus Peregrinibacteria bacterium]|nr:hypothetical protein [Candidatus Peregrinibacteria bacterium]